MVGASCGRVRYHEEPLDGGTDAFAPMDVGNLDDARSSLDASRAPDVGLDARAPPDARLALDATSRFDVGPDVATALDAASGDVGSDIGPADAALPIGTHNVAFLTPLLPNAAFGGLTGADALCARYAREGGFGGTFVAYLSTSTVDAIDRLAGAEGWARPDGLPIARTRADLLERGALIYPPSLDHLGVRNPPGELGVYTGTRLDGRLEPGQACDDWTRATGSVTGGAWDMASWDWHARSGFSCGVPGRLFCFQVDHAVPPPIPAPVGGRRIFAAYRPTTSETPDAACARVAASLGGTYRALVATSTGSAADRFTLDRWPWVTASGLIVARSMSDLTTDGLWTSVRQVDGSSAAFSMLATGARGVFTPGGASCGDWTSSSATESVPVGLVGRASQRWFGESNAACSNPMWFYCLEE